MVGGGVTQYDIANIGETWCTSRLAVRHDVLAHWVICGGAMCVCDRLQRLWLLAVWFLTQQ